MGRDKSDFLSGKEPKRRGNLSGNLLFLGAIFAAFLVFLNFSGVGDTIAYFVAQMLPFVLVLGIAIFALKNGPHRYDKK